MAQARCLTLRRAWLARERLATPTFARLGLLGQYSDGTLIVLC